MIRNRCFDTACLLLLALGIALTFALPALGRAGIVTPARNDAYLGRLFQSGTVHTIDIEHDDWNGFIARAPEEEYIRVDITIDGERFSGVGLRAKGNNSLGHVARRGLARYSLKIEFDHYEDSLSYHGLDKLSLDAAFQDNSYLKNYLALDMMRFMGVPTPATSFVFITVNGEAWGLFLAIEEAEDAFAERIWGEGHGMLYKPDYRSLEDENADVAKQGLQVGDIITKLDNQEVYDTQTVDAVLVSKSPGDTILLTVYRVNEETGVASTVEITAVLAEKTA